MVPSKALEHLQGFHPIISCEGTGEEVVVKKLVAADALVFPSCDVVDITRKRKAQVIQSDYLGFEYDWPVCIMRILDSPRERFRLGHLYADRFPVVNVYTRPEIEMLVIIRKGRYHDYSKKKSSMKPSVYCKDVLGLHDVKSATFLEDYWDVESIVVAAQEYRRLSHLERNELCLADVVK
ncbi:MAG: hypothetical protein IKF78_10320 [Atopobiaceae bacterium]|nr:hypothetical protein [Atopobiaceae bacterium]